MEIFLAVRLLTNYSFMQSNFVCQCFFMQARKTDFEDPNICDQKYSNIVIKNIEAWKAFQLVAPCNLQGNLWTFHGSVINI